MEVLLFGPLATIVLLLNWSRDRYDADALGFPIMLVMIWALSGWMVSRGTRPDNMGLLSAMDLVGGLAAWLAYRRHRTGWLRAMTWLFLASLVVHAAFWSFYRLLPMVSPAMAYWIADPAAADERKAVRNLYVLGLSLLSYAQLASSAWPGGSSAVRSLGAHLSRNSRRRHPVGS